jgi:tRNA U34 5-methylaminomethyl-2-thiouridine-forming methyltransferase MnmC
MSIFTTGDGSPSMRSERFGAAYHSPSGAVSESDHVFIKNGFKALSARQADISVLEAGFGTGLNAFMTWLEAEKTGRQVRYTGLELYPIAEQEAASLHYAVCLGLPERHADFLRLHECPWESPQTLSPHFILEKRRTPIETFQSPPAFDLIYFDAFAPSDQPELWVESIFHSLFQALRPGGLLVTYCAQGEFRRRLRRAGFQVERLPGIGGKWEITRAEKG